jgi:integrase
VSRSNGEGSVYQRSSDGRWIGSFYEDVQGQRKRRVIYAKTRKEANSRLQKALGRIDQGLPGIDSGSAFREVAETWRRTSMRTSGLSSASTEAYVGALKRKVYPVIGDVKLKDLKPSHVSKVLVVMQDQGLSNAYQNTAHKAMSTVFKFAMAEGLMATNPALSVKVKRANSKEKVVPDREQVLAMIAAADEDQRLKTLVCVLAYTGCRISEALSLEWSDVTGELIRIRNGKGAKSRAVPLVPALAEQLKAWKSHQAAERLASIWWDDSHDYVLASDCGTFWDPHNARKKFRPLVEGVESDDPAKARPAICPGATPHSLRHATATLLLEEGVSMKVVAELLGHSSVRITQDTYSHVTARLVAEAGEALGRALG